MASDLKGFEKALKDFAEKVNKEVADVVRESSFRIYRNITAKTAVGNWSIWKSQRPPYSGYVGGHLKASLLINAERPNISGVASSWSASSSPKPSLPPLKQDPTVWINSNLPYSNRVLNEGWSKQTPKNMADNEVKKEFLRLKAAL